MKKFLALTLATSLGSVAVADTEELEFESDRAFFDGYLEISGVGGSSSINSVTSAVLDFGLQPKLTGIGIGFGFGLGLDVHKTTGGGSDTNYALYATGEVGTQIGKFSFGIPRSVIDRGYMPVRKFSYSSLIETGVAGDRSLLGMLHLLDHESVYGLRYDGEFGATKIGLSFHHIGGTIDTDFLALAFRHDLAAISSFSEIAIFGGIETVADGGATGRVYRLGAEGDFGNATVGIKRVQYSQFPLPLDSTELYVDYAFGDRITANASYRAYDDSGQPDFIAIGAEYEFSEFGYVDAGYLDSTSSGISPIYEISVGVKF